jgi:hypothetical protein
MQQAISLNVIINESYNTKKPYSEDHSARAHRTEQSNSLIQTAHSGPAAPSNTEMFICKMLRLQAAVHFI